MENQANFDSFIFTHIPKCGGSSLRKLVFDSAIGSGLSPNQVHIPGEGGLDHSKNIGQLSETEYNSLISQGIKVLADHTKLDYGLYQKLGMNNPFVFTVVRAPFDRFLSHYNFFYKKLGHGKLKNTLIQTLQTDRLEKIVANQANVIAAYLLNEEPGANQVYHFTSRISELEHILQHKLNAIGTLEDIDGCLSMIKHSKPNWFAWDNTLPRLNSNQYKPDFEGIKKVRQLFIKYNQLDIRLYQYINALKNLRQIQV